MMHWRLRHCSTEFSAPFSFTETNEDGMGGSSHHHLLNLTKGRGTVNKGKIRMACENDLKTVIESLTRALIFLAFARHACHDVSCIAMHINTKYHTYMTSTQQTATLTIQCLFLFKNRGLSRRNLRRLEWNFSLS